MNNNSEVLNELKLFSMKNLLLESDLINIEKSGIEIGHVQTLKKDEVVDLELFEFDIRKQARKMADFYVIYYALENSIRRLISETLKEKYGSNWWEDKIPKDVREEIHKRQEKEKDSVISMRSDDYLAYTNFGELIQIFEANWDDFSAIIRSKKAMKQILSQFNMLRNVIAHSCELIDDEITRFELLIKDWMRIQM
ncbi:MAG: Swt1 family HEPN domain-containing protein [Nitrospiraceae bacterium]|nr:Swt1 family HEPN domain-containing protein [Nitrospirota bacterium]MDA8340585.1 Swt1 family HEPN domain-containing protein [Nitrospiraceae bacterium]